MKTLKTILGYSWAILAVPIVLATFFGNDHFSRYLAASTGVVVSPWQTGGEVLREVDHGAYRTIIHRPVFEGLFTERRHGFVQIRWEPAAGLPASVSDGIDCNGDGKGDFTLTLDTAATKASVSGAGPLVEGLEGPYKLKNGWAVRIALVRGK